MSDARPSGRVGAAISDGLVGLHTRYYGKGPTQVKTHLADDVVLSLLWGGFTQVEQTLIASGRSRTVVELRRAFQDSMEHEFIRVVEEATGRRVVVYLSQVHVDPNLSAELFVLAPGSRPQAGASGRTATPSAS